MQVFHRRADIIACGLTFTVSLFKFLARGKKFLMVHDGKSFHSFICVPTSHMVYSIVSLFNFL